MRALTKTAPSAKPNRRPLASSLIMLDSLIILSLETKASAAIARWGPHRIGVEFLNAVVCRDRSDRSSSMERSIGTFVPLNENKFRFAPGRAGYRRQGGRDAG